MNSNFDHSIRVGLVDLSTSKISIKSHSFQNSAFNKYLGGEGLAADYLLREMPPKADPLGPDNILCFITGVLSGTVVPFSGRFIVAGKSPLTGTWGEANSGGRFGPELRQAGFDLLLIKGKAEALSILNITNDSIEIIPSPNLKGLDCVETEIELKKKYGLKAQVASIGLAGENLVLITGIITDKARVAARSGLGAVMGSKNLKAVVARGTKDIPIFDPDGLRELRTMVNKWVSKGLNFLLKPSLKMSTTFAPWLRRFKVKNYESMSTSSMIIESYKRWGTAAGTAVLVETGDAPVKNWKGCYKDFPLKKSAKLATDSVTKYRIRKYGCKRCPMACGGIMEYKDEQYDLPETQKPEYETLAMLGSNLLNDDLGSIYAMNDYCNRQGLDTIAVGSILGYLMEAKENGIITKNDLGELNIEWGNSKDLLPLIKMITNREGIGDLLAEGVGNAAKELGGEEFAIHINNQAIPAHDPRFAKAFIIPYRLDPSPGRHTPFTEVMIDISKFQKLYPSLNKMNRTFDYYCYHQTISTLGLCQFGLVIGNYPALEFVNLVTGLNLSIEDFIKIGERTLTVKHLFNLREGINPLDYELPRRILEKAEDGPNQDVSLIEEEGKIIKEFLTALKWDLNTTIPDSDHLKELMLEDFIIKS
ncbi:MAG: aldehyde ferredoxin oxidoreductase family protein [Candidatus Heimdallarchaeota archaeon]|nr:MAG: aldehyde ferredoxin oxidoreductase family protein [Candidatus Heimdallarchaeota archaeon]